MQKAFRRAARRGLLWPEEATQLVREGRSLEELSGIGPYLRKLIHRWIEDPPAVPQPPEIRSDFLTLPQAKAILTKEPSWLQDVRGDLQMHTQWSDGSGSLEQMAEAAAIQGYEYIAITDHSKGLKIAGALTKSSCNSKPTRLQPSMTL